MLHQVLKELHTLFGTVARRAPHLFLKMTPEMSEKPQLRMELMCSKCKTTTDPELLVDDTVLKTFVNNFMLMHETCGARKFDA